MIKLRDSQGNISTIKDSGEMEFDNKHIEEGFKQAEQSINNEQKK